jgi:hypothetical protein
LGYGIRSGETPLVMESMRLTTQPLGYGSHPQLNRFIIVHVASCSRTIQQRVLLCLIIREPGITRVAGGLFIEAEFLRWRNGVTTDSGFHSAPKGVYLVLCTYRLLLIAIYNKDATTMA